MECLKLCQSVANNDSILFASPPARSHIQISRSLPLTSFLPSGVKPSECAGEDWTPRKVLNFECVRQFQIVIAEFGPSAAATNCPSGLKATALTGTVGSSTPVELKDIAFCWPNIVVSFEARSQTITVSSSLPLARNLPSG